jgi:hypothetical protein
MRRLIEALRAVVGCRSDVAALGDAVGKDAGGEGRDRSVFNDLYARERAWYDSRRKGWEVSGGEQPIRIAARLIGSRVDSLGDDELLEAWACYVRGEDGSDFLWYDLVQHLFESRDEAMANHLSWLVERAAWLCVVAERWPGLEIKYLMREGGSPL